MHEQACQNCFQGEVGEEGRIIEVLEELVLRWVVEETEKSSKRQLQ